MTLPSRRRAVLAFTATILLAGCLLQWLVHQPVTYPDGLCRSVYGDDVRDVPEYSRLVKSETSVIPPGTKCSFAFGNEVMVRTYVPWFEWMLIAVFSVALGLVTLLTWTVVSRLARRKRRTS